MTGVCPICTSQALESGPNLGDLVQRFECPRCGRFYMHLDMRDALRSERSFPHTWKREEVWHRLSSWVRDQQEQRLEAPTIFWQPDLSWLPRHGVREQIDLLLQLIASRAVSYSMPVTIHAEADAVLLWARGAEDVRFLITAAQEQQRIEVLVPGGEARVRLKVEGYARLEELERSDVLNDQLFVAMWFPPTGHAEHENMLAAYRDGILKAIAAAGYRKFRVDDEPVTDDPIDARIMVNIRRSRGMVADMTGHRPNVAFEVGFAKGLELPVLWTVRKNWLEKLPFDVRQFPFLVWETPAEIAAQLKPRIEDRFGIRNGRMK